MALVPGHDVDLVALDLAAELHLGLPLRRSPPAAERPSPWASSGSRSSSWAICSLERFRPMKYRHQDPDPQRLVVAGEDRAGQVVEPLAAAVALVALPLRLGVVPARPWRPRRSRTRGTARRRASGVARTVSKHLASSMRARMLTSMAGAPMPCGNERVGLLGLDCRARARGVALISLEHRMSLAALPHSRCSQAFLGSGR